MADYPAAALSADDEDSYRLQIAGFPRLSPEEEQRLLATRGPAREVANQKLIEHNLDLVFEAACARKERGVPFGDLFQEGTVGLISAVEHYRAPAARFRANLRTAIAATMDDILAQTADAQRNDQAFVQACSLLEAAQRLLAKRLQRPATTAEIAKLLRWEEDRVLVIQDMLEGARSIHDRELLDYLDDLDLPEGETG
jgi:DNA-directed RNA polymerase sigma subunit (sigma70/sigma32)